MPLNSSGPISIGGSTTGQSINLELGRSATAQSNLNETALRTLAGVPSGAISLSNFYGKSNFTPTTVTYNSGSGTETAPTGWSSCRIRIWGGGGGGGVGASGTGGGGGGGGFSERTITGSGSATINYVVGLEGFGRCNSSSGSGTAGGGTSQVGNLSATGAFSGTNMTANGGAAGGASAGGAGGTASGGTTNTTGSSGVTTPGAQDGGGDAAGTGGGDGGQNMEAVYDDEADLWTVTQNPLEGSAPGGGGGAGGYSTIGNGLDVCSLNGAAGRVEFYYT